MPKDFSFTATGFSTMDSTSGEENLPPAVNKPQIARLFRTKNARFNNDGGVEIRNGFDLLATLTSGEKVDTMGKIRLFGFAIAKNGTKVEQSADGETWYDMGITRTLAEREMILGHRKDFFLSNVTDGFNRVACSTLRGAHAASAGTINVRFGDIDQFADSGSFWVEGIEVTYTGRNTGASTLTGATGVTKALSDGALMSQESSDVTGTVITGINPAPDPNGTCMAEFQGSIIVGGVPEVPEFVIWSAPPDGNNPEFSYDFSGNGAGAKPLPSNVKALAASEDRLLIGTDDGLFYSNGYIDGELVILPLSDHKINNAFCIVRGDKGFYVLTQDGEILQVADQKVGNSVRFGIQGNLDYFIKGEVDRNLDADQDLSFIHYNDSLVTANMSLDGLYKEVTLQLDNMIPISKTESAPATNIDVGKNFACRLNFKNKVLAGSDYNSEVYEDDKGRTDNTIPINFKITSGIFRLGKKGLTGDYLMNTFGGLMNDLGEFTLRMSFDIDDPWEEIITAQDMLDEGLMLKNSVITDGIGRQRIGHGADAVDAYKFDYPLEFSEEAETAQMEIETEDEGTVLNLRYFNLIGETEGALLLNVQ